MLAGVLDRSTAETRRRQLVVTVDDPRAADVRALLRVHLEFCKALSPPEDVHALDLDGLLDPSVTFLTARRDRALLAIGAIKELDATHGELKSMHTVAPARGQGVGRAVLERLVDVARERGYRRVSLETGSMEGFRPARSLYEHFGFEPCEPFGDYAPSPHSTFMTLRLAPAR
jgi:putative acetyltransferase